MQGVWYRATTKKQADRFEVKGWVKNLPDGSVEAVFEGEKKTVEELINWCHRGPKLATVESIDVHWETPAGLTSPFKIKY